MGGAFSGIYQELDSIPRIETDNACANATVDSFIWPLIDFTPDSAHIDLSIMVWGINGAEKVQIQAMYWDANTTSWHSQPQDITSDGEYHFSLNCSKLLIKTMNTVDSIHLCYAATATYGD